jgi:hypothetical protein
MAGKRQLRLCGWIAVAALGTACSNNSSSDSSTNPNSPGGTSGSSCRTYSTAADVSTRTSGTSIVFNAKETANFDASAKKVTVETKFANGTACNTAISSYNSVADFVDEVRVIPPVNLQTGSTSTNSGGCPGGSGSNTFTYDSQRRLTAIVPNTGNPTTYTAWDSSGRPTAGSSGGASISIAYDNAARTQTQTQTSPAATSTLSFDANGILTSSVVSSGGVTSTTTFTTTSTATVCK